MHEGCNSDLITGQVEQYPAVSPKIHNSVPELLLPLNITILYYLLAFFKKALHL